MTKENRLMRIAGSMAQEQDATRGKILKVRRLRFPESESRVSAGLFARGGGVDTEAVSPGAWSNQDLSTVRPMAGSGPDQCAIVRFAQTPSVNLSVAGQDNQIQPARNSKLQGDSR
jgi:hypothetical protein